MAFIANKDSNNYYNDHSVSNWTGNLFSKSIKNHVMIGYFCWVNVIYKHNVDINNAWIEKYSLYE